MQIKYLFLVFHVFSFHVPEIRSWATLRKYKGHILLITGLGIMQHDSVMHGICGLWTVGVATKKLAHVAGAVVSKNGVLEEIPAVNGWV
jgi:hypothetical protein